MRVTNNITTKQFLRNNNMALTNMLRSENRIETQRRFNRVSEDTINGGRAMIIRRQLRDLDIYKENLSSSKALFSAAEVNLISVTHDDYIKVEEKLVAATNGTWDQMELDIYAEELDEIAENMVFTLNNDFSERELFGGASNAPTPFKVERVIIKDGNGKVVFPPDFYKYYENVSDADMRSVNELLGKFTDAAATNAQVSDSDIRKFQNLTGMTVTENVTQNAAGDDEYSYTAEINGTTFDLTDLTSGAVEITPDGNIRQGANEEALGGLLRTHLDSGETQIKDSVSVHDIPKVVTYNGIPLDFDVTSKMILPNGQKVDVGPDANGNYPSYTVNYLDSDTKLWKSETQSIDPKNVETAITKKDNSLLYPGSLPIYVDIGLGIKYNENYEVDDPQTALDVSMNGAEITGNGIDVSKAKVSFDYTTKGIDLMQGFPSTPVNVTINGQTFALDLSGGFTTSADANETYANITNALNRALKAAIPAGTAGIPNDISIKYDGGNITFSSLSEEFTVESGDLGVEAGRSALEITDRYSKNLIQLVLDSAAALRRGDQYTTNAVIDRANEANSHILKQITVLGTKQTTIDFYLQRNEDYKFSLQERQNTVEGTDMEEEITRYEAIKAAYDATLKMGSQILPHSIFDFI